MKRTVKISAIAGGSAVILGAATVAAVALSHSSGASAASGTASSVNSSAARARLTDATCSGPAGAAYVADAGWDGFTAINTANCAVITTYNVGDGYTPGFPDDQSYDSTAETIAVHGSTLYFADTGNSRVSVIDTTTLDPKDYNPAETDINVGMFPEALAVTPDGSQLWVANTGPRTSPSEPTSVSVIATATNKVIATLPLKGAPSQVAFSPDGSRAYVVTANGLFTYSVRSRHVICETTGLGDPRSAAVAPGGRSVYVTDTQDNAIKVVSTSSGRVTATIRVGLLPWADVVSADGRTLYVANPDSDQVSVISTARNKVAKEIPVTGDPDTLALTADGSQLWVGQKTLAYVDVIDTATGTEVSDLNLAGTGTGNLNYADGYGPTGIALLPVPAPGS
ncbi:MAG TPA: hypothetical protein VH478_05495 [Trebonia sp.]|jgi:YVTN family beta-propeller protein|nr:hypothetical protein [Trebonia sp.]